MRTRRDNLTPARLSTVVKISRQFLRSVRIDTDIGREDALDGYICQGTARGLLDSMANQVRETRQRAFTWTGPYGGGKSSLALMLCSLVGGNPVLREKARRILALPESSAIDAAFETSDSGWLVVPVVGRRASVGDEIGKSLATALGAKGSKKGRKRQVDIIGELVTTAEQHPNGVLLVIDELGKFLENTALEGDDVYFFQELAEAASRTAGKLIVVGILHQAFDAYAARLGRQARDDWAKVQGRYVDIPLVAGTDEVVELIGRAIEVDANLDHAPAAPIAKIIANSIRERRPGTPPNIGISIERCWPLHPVVASLLGPISRRRFSQNERSTFGFLASREPLGFVEFLSGAPVNWASMYGPAHYWDYLHANLDQAILASPDGHRWAVAAEAVERAENKGSSLHVELAKCVALIEMFRSGSGLVPDVTVLGACVQGAVASNVSDSLNDLVAWKILIERKHVGGFGVFAGSDFDIEGAVNTARGEIAAPDLQRLSTLAELQPILAKRLYHETGTMRWFTRSIVRLDGANRDAALFQKERGSVGAFLLCLPDVGANAAIVRSRAKKISAENPADGLVVGVPENADRIAELGLELVACERVLKTRPELDGDAVARKELLNRISAVQATLEDELGDAFSLSKWYWSGELCNGAQDNSISAIASRIAESIFPGTPRINNELINRDEPSSNSNRARKDLLYRMVSHSDEENLGYSGYPADAGLYFSVLKPTGLHRAREGKQWSFGDPGDHESGEAMRSLWQETKSFLLKEGANSVLSDLYDLWGKPPFGLRKGLMPVLTMAFFLANRASLALYVENAFTPELTEATIDEWLLDPKRISLRYVQASTDREGYVRAVLDSLPSTGSRPAAKDPLSVARALVGLVVGLPNWTRRTTTVSPQAQAVRGMLLKANDPNKVLFTDLPTLLAAQTEMDVGLSLRRIVSELLSAYPQVISEVKTLMLRALDQADGDISAIQTRARVVKGIAGEFRLEAFVARLDTFNGSIESIEGLISLATNKPPAQWVDRDIDGALLQLGTWAHDFRRAETLAPMRGRPSTRRAIGVVFGGGMGREAMASIDIDEKDSSTVSRLAAQLLASLQQQHRGVALAALAEAGALLLAPHQPEVT